MWFAHWYLFPLSENSTGNLYAKSGAHSGRRRTCNIYSPMIILVPSTSLVFYLSILSTHMKSPTAMTDRTVPKLRPYRSHKIPACDLCRSRKIRCSLDIAGQSCRFCREKDVKCTYSGIVSSSIGQITRPAKRQRISSGTSYVEVTEPNDFRHGLLMLPRCNRDFAYLVFTIDESHYGGGY